MQKLWKSLLLSGLLVGGMCAFGAQAEAVYVDIDNQIGKNLSAAVVYFDENRNAWVCKGWFAVKPNSFRRLNFPTHARPNIWVHMHNPDRSWGGSKAWTVIGDAFDYRLADGCPGGPNRRQVTFRNYEIGESGGIRLNAR